ncbi:MAG: N-acetylmuramoyl-L-alanine amidase family protein [Brotaphodocola sp.]
MAEEKHSRKQTVPKWKMISVLVVDVLLACAILITGTLLAVKGYHESRRPVLSELTAPEWYTQEFLKVNPYSRPGTKREEILDIVVHYVANPGTTASQNRNYFANLANQTSGNKTSASSHFIIGIDGEILQLIPLDEVAYANYPRNRDTVSIECCHPDSTGEFTEATKESLVRLTAWLCQELYLTEKNVIRHYDVTGKNCPKFYVEHEDAWKEIIKEIKKKRKES